MAKTIFITGSSTGLGRAAAFLFSKRGWRVFASMRSPEKAGELADVPNVSVLALDVRRPDQIEVAAQEALREGPIDVLFNNAGYGLAGPFEGTTDAELVAEVETNLLGALRVARAFIPSFRERRSGTILTTTSIGGHVTYPFNAVYHATKWALEGWSESLAFELEEHGIRVKTVAPGGIRSDFAGRSLVVVQHPAYATAVQKALRVFTDPSRTASHSTPEAIAEVVYEAVTDDKDQVTYVAGADATATLAERLALGAEAFRRGIARAFFG